MNPHPHNHPKEHPPLRRMLANEGKGLPIVQQNSPNNLPPPKMSPHSSSLADSSYFSRSSSSDVEHLTLSRECSGGSNASSSFPFNGTKESLDEEEFFQKMKICEGGDGRMEIDPKILEFAIRLGFGEEKLRTILMNLDLEEGENIEQDRILSELVKLGVQNTAKTMERRMGEWPKLRPIVLNGSNIAMTHGNKMVRGHSDILVFVPHFRREQSRPDAPIVDQHILMELEAKRQLIWTPSRRIGNRRIVCHDDRYILKTAAEKQAIIVSNDEYRDLVKENAEWKSVVDNFLLIYTFVNGKFMPPDDPLGRRGPNLEQFLTFSKIPMNSQPCPYAKKCTYGNKCKYFHPERPNGIRIGAADRLIAGMELASTKVHSTLGQQNHSNIGRTKSLNLPPKMSPAPQQHSPILRIESSPVHCPSIDHYGQHMFKPSPIWGDCEFSLSPNPSISSPSSHQQNDRLRLQYHLSQLFPESAVLAVMAAHPNEMNGQRLCQRIIAFQNEYGRIPTNE